MKMLDGLFVRGIANPCLQGIQTTLREKKNIEIMCFKFQIEFNV